ncbi:MAG: TlpA family protein disulfide reductase [Tenuifilaceae bacterium]
MKFIKLILLFLLTQSTLFSQVNVQIRIKQAITKNAKLYYYQNNDLKVIDSAYHVSPGFFRFQLPSSHSQGLYKFTLGKNINFDFIVASEPEIALETVVFAAEDSLKSIFSQENEVYIQLNKFKKKLTQQIWHLNSLNDYYSDTSYFKQNINKELYRINTEIQEYSHKIVEGNPNLFASNLILLGLKPIPPYELSTYDQKNYTIQNWWSRINLNDVRIINVPGFEKKLWDYMELLFEENLDKEEQDLAFIEGIKTLMNLNSDLLVKEYFRNTLFTGLIENDYIKSAEYIANTRIAGLTDIKSKIDSTLKNKLGLGYKVFDFKIQTPEGGKTKLSSIKSDVKLILFWSKWCPHCIEMLPEVYSIYQTYKSRGLEVIAISIDEDEGEWKSFLKEKKYNWINTLEPDNGENKVIENYKLEETPKIILIDKDLRIVSLPSNSKQLIAKLKKLLR